mmetsp:Transcript_11278/g.17449  ORF Transcript_11278/g.17449 Transcript_11278/m.17449 type:complete len:405 (+) Transcript_11278:179-1393(+)|eukprot:CAMPEP_0195305632 /NCGR_PEP_ID=MMETSP0707-20130614/36629_1 /TAXON_ID=33640 /ORGANISM="Asterionellopsis glacialis, Strain CCMP134" /LENGTH=404 /DNA_ID=CAMNT_0040369797 /DNA_START=57 /DNA_END=1271 /DNA_ORIENTATION=+
MVMAVTYSAGSRSLLLSKTAVVVQGIPPTATATTGFPRLWQQRREASTLILLRHGQSIWNGLDNRRFTGWCDVPLTVRGRVEAVGAGQLLRSRGYKAKNVDVAFTSELQRAHETCELALASMAGAEQHTWSSERIRRDWRLNERHYGCVQGTKKDDPRLQEVYGEKMLTEWRRSMHGKAPPMERTHEYWRPPPAPLTESLADCQKRAIECFKDSISTAMFDEEDLPTPPDLRTVIVVAHANTIRSLMAAFDEVPEELVPKLHVPNSVPILYRFNRTTRKPVSRKLQSAAGESHARWLISAENHHAVRAAVQSGGILTRALFEKFDKDNNRKVTVSELNAGLNELLKDDEHPPDCVVLAVAKEIAREMSHGEEITLSEFERRAMLASKDLHDSWVFSNSINEPFP